MSYRINLILAFWLVGFSSLFSEDKDIDKIIEFQTQKFKYILETAYKYHPDSLDLVKISDDAFLALMLAMDKECYYYSQAQYKKLQETNSGIAYGIGAELVSINDTLYVIQVFPNTPASESGLEVGDIVAAIGKKSTRGMPKNEADELIQGDSATYAEITILSVYDRKESKLKIQRKDLAKTSLTTAYLFPKTNVGVFTINRFSDNSPEEFKKKAKEFISKGMGRVIIDLRGNPGGYMLKVDEILDFFVGDSKLLSRSVSGSPDFESKFFSKPGDFLENIPLVVLIDGNSASGSELLAGVIQDYDRGIVVGKKSYGKGTIQKVWTMNDSTGFKLTVGKYLTPSGRDIQKYDNGEIINIDAGLNSDVITKEFSQKVSEMGGFQSMKIFKSEKGRPIIGGGGVVPDVIIDRDTLTQLTSLLIRRGLFFKWAVDYKQREGKNLIEKYGDDYSKFNLEFNITDELLREFASFALENKLWNNDMFNIDKSYFINYQKASIANAIWGYDAFSEVLSIVDNQIISCLKEIPNAENMINNK